MTIKITSEFLPDEMKAYFLETNNFLPINHVLS